MIRTYEEHDVQDYGRIVAFLGKLCNFTMEIEGETWETRVTTHLNTDYLCIRLAFSTQKVEAKNYNKNSVLSVCFSIDEALTYLRPLIVEDLDLYLRSTKFNCQALVKLLVRIGKLSIVESASPYSLVQLCLKDQSEVNFNERI